MTIAVTRKPLDTLLDRLTSNYTPDFRKLNQRPFMILLDYGSLINGALNHHLLDGTPYLGTATTLCEMFRLEHTVSQAVAFDERSNHSKGRIRGEAYLVDPLQMLQIDKFYQNGLVFQRKEVSCTLDEQRTKHEFITSAWMYLGIDHYWKTKPALIRGLNYVEQGKLIYEW